MEMASVILPTFTLQHRFSNHDSDDIGFMMCMLPLVTWAKAALNQP